MRQRIAFTFSLLISLFVGCFGGIFVYEKYFDGKEKTITEVNNKVINEVSVTENDTIQPGIAKIYDAVYYIASYRNKSLYSSGTGFAYKKDDKYGYIITNHHVISNATSVKVTDINGKTIDAELLGSDEYSDIAVLRIDAKEIIKICEIGDSTELELGDTLFTVGSPLGIEYIGSVTKGILSGKAREVEVDLTSGGSFIMEVIQTDAAISPGNSGGPLCNINGEVIGVNSLKIVDEDVEGMGFAIPIEIVMGLVERLETGEEIVRPYLGVGLAEVTDEWNLYKLDIEVPKGIEYGVVLTTIDDDTPAEISGFKVGDIILEIEGTKVKNVAHFRYLLYKYEVGDTVEMKCYRNGKEKTIKVKFTMSVDEA